MYEEHWQLNGRPFENSVGKGSAYYPAECHQAALLKLIYAIENRRGLALLCGQTGVGKSLIVQLLRTRLPENSSPLITVSYPALNPTELVRYIAQSLNPAEETRTYIDTADAVLSIQNSLRRFVEQGRHPVLVFEEAHLMESYSGLETARLLLNLLSDESEGESVWTMIFSGLPTLLAQVNRYQPLDERLAVKCVLSPFTADETTSYIQHRVRCCGGDAERIFTRDAIDSIHVLSGGIPRRINRLGDLALMLAFAEDRQQINTEVIEGVQADLLPIA
ncbi:MAG: AAA family ATPase [Planctomycetes bacterium]|nr:AAA family ATPase [Planctomycetota bacterium]